ncbi:potassium channel family protein [Tateyamaria omphalii]|uniref:potassium channel family protein n=1 Tax=Tateyamaria omphalii TaxID=299262 RepID=UPI001C99AAF1|nr:ion channel [Tateyamaria omphalii]MBY5932530.1 potassium channel family protein [Tateyamaria omphalii]
MTTAAEIGFGSALLILCAIVHVGIVTGAIPLISSVATLLGRTNAIFSALLLLIFGVIVILMAHTIQVWSWAFVFLISGAFGGFADAFYFSMVTYTTLGYGDIVLDEGLRIFATFAAVTGLLTFGISTAFLMTLISALFPNIRNHDN